LKNRFSGAEELESYLASYERKFRFFNAISNITINIFKIKRMDLRERARERERFE